MSSIYKLKDLGHQLLNEYVLLDRKRVGKSALEHAYEKLGTKIGALYGRHHFAKMESKREITQAIRALKRMIKKRQQKNKFLGVVEYADPKIVKKQLEIIKKRRDATTKSI